MQFTDSYDFQFWIETCENEAKQTKLASWLPSRHNCKRHVALLKYLMKTNNVNATDQCIRACGSLEQIKNVKFLVHASPACLQLFATRTSRIPRATLVFWLSSIIDTISQESLVLICARWDLDADEHAQVLAVLCCKDDVAMDRILFTKRMFTLVENDDFPETVFGQRMFVFANAPGIVRSFEELKELAPQKRYTAMLSKCHSHPHRQYFFNYAVRVNEFEVADWIFGSEINFGGRVEIADILVHTIDDSKIAVGEQTNNGYEPWRETEHCTDAASVLYHCQHNDSRSASFPMLLNMRQMCFINNLMKFYDIHPELQVPTNLLFCEIQRALSALENRDEESRKFLLHVCLRMMCCDDLTLHLLKLGTRVDMSIFWVPKSDHDEITEQQQEILEHIWTFQQAQLIENAMQLVCAAVCTRNKALWNMLVMHAERLLLPLIRMDEACEFLEYLFYNNRRFFQQIWPFYNLQQQKFIVEDCVKHALRTKNDTDESLSFFDAQENIQLSDVFLSRYWTALGMAGAFRLIADWMKRTEIWTTQKTASRKIATSSLTKYANFKTLWDIVPEAFGDIRECLLEPSACIRDHRICLYLIREGHVSFEAMVDITSQNPNFSKQSDMECDSDDE